ncbi:MAG: hypothetical protein ACAH80_12425 [Alphaproteobacteria bacterium]
MLRDTFTELTTEFNTAAEKAIKTDAAPLLLLTRYSALLRYKAQSTDEKEAVAAMLFNKGIELLNSFAPPASQEAIVNDTRRAHASNTKGYTNAIFNRLLEPDSLPYLPENAAEKLADATLALARRTETITRDHFRNSYYGDNEATEYKKSLRELAETALNYADKVTAMKAASSTAAVIGQKIAPAAKIQLRQPDNG